MQEEEKREQTIPPQEVQPAERDGGDALERLLREDREIQSAFDRKVGQALQTARAKWEREQAKTLRETEEAAAGRAQAAAEEQVRLMKEDLEAREVSFQLRLRRVDTAEELHRRGLSAEFAPWLTGESKEESLQRVEEFERAFRGALSDTVTDRMRGAEIPAQPRTAPAFDRDTLRSMSPKEINAHWAEIQNTLKG